MRGSAKAFLGNAHSLGLIDAQKAGSRAPREPEARVVALSAPHRPITAADIAADPEFLEWAEEERAAELAYLTVRALR